MKITIKQYSDVLDINESSYTRSMIKMYSVLNPTKDINKVSMDDLTDAVRGYKQTLSKDILSYKEDEYKSLNTMSLSEYITIDNLIGNNNYLEIVKLVYPTIDDTDNESYEIIWGYRQVLKERQILLKAFDNLLQDSTFDYDKALENKELSEDDKRIIVEDRKDHELSQTYNWDLLLIDLTSRDISKIDKVLQMNIVTIFRMMTALKIYDSKK